MIPKSRYSSVNYYISNSDKFNNKYNDVKSKLKVEMMDYLKKEAEKHKVNVDDQMLQHIGYLFVRDALVIYDNTIHDDEPNSTRHFE